MEEFDVVDADVAEVKPTVNPTDSDVLFSPVTAIAIHLTAQTTVKW